MAYSKPILLIGTSNINEYNYCKAVAKLVDTSLVDSDIVQLNTSNFDTLIAAAIAYDTKPVVVFPYTYNTSYPGKVFRQYPKAQIVTSYFYNVSGVNYPYNIPVEDYSKITPMVQVNGGLAGTGLSDWLNGVQLEFVEPAHIMYLSGSTNILTFPVTNIVRNSGKARLSCVGIHFFAAFGYIVHVVNGGTGFTANPTGARNVYAIGTDYVDINFDVIGGTYNGSGTYITIEFDSGSIAAVGAKLRQIMIGRECSFWEARYCARITGSRSGTRDNTHGYGQIDVAAAIAYSGSIIADPYDTLGTIGSLALTKTRPKAIFTMPEVANAKAFLFFDNNELRSEVEVDFEDSLNYELNPYGIGDHTYHVKATRYSTESAFSNDVTTNEQTLINLPAKPKYNPGDLVYALRDGVIVYLQVVDVRIIVSNPYEDVVGRQVNYYTFHKIGFSSVLSYELSEDKVFVSPNDIASYLKAQIYPQFDGYLNADEQGAPIYLFDIDNLFHNPFGEDFSGQYLGDLDWSLVGYDFTNDLIDGASFVNAILPVGQSELYQMILAVKSYHKERSIWIDGEPFGEHVALKLKAFLEGNFSAGAMGIDLRTAGVIPLAQPYGTGGAGSHYAYNGGETVAAIPANVVDWVYLELRSLPGGTEVARRAAFIKSNGSIVDLDGISDVIFPRVDHGEYYVIVGHRNHLPIMSAFPIQVSGSTPLYDFTSDDAQAYGGDQKALTGGVFGLYAGDANKSFIISSADSALITSHLTESGYLAYDVNLTGIVSSTDATLASANNGKATNIPSFP